MEPISSWRFRLQQVVTGTKLVVKRASEGDAAVPDAVRMPLGANARPSILLARQPVLHGVEGVKVLAAKLMVPSLPGFSHPPRAFVKRRAVRGALRMKLVRSDS